MRSATRETWFAFASLLAALAQACGEPTAMPRVTTQTSGGEALRAAGDGCAEQRAGITLSTLLTEMVDMTHLTRLPEVPYTSHMKSSHNPRSDGARPGSADWHADQDYTRVEGGSETLLELDGPGVITRIWSASPRGVLRIFIDGAPQPAVEANLSELLRGDVAPFHAPFAFIAAYGHNLYFPIAFAKGCRVTLSDEPSKKKVYYQIAYRRYPRGTLLESFGPQALAAAACARRHTAARLLDPAVLPRRAGDELAAFALDSAAGATHAAEIAAPDGGGVLRELRLTPANSSPALLRATALVIEMDGEVTVRAPVLDFFAVGFEGRVVNSLPVSANERGELSARWPMPFRRKARVWLEHAGAGALTAALTATFGPAPFGHDSLYFYAGWHAPEIATTEPKHDKLLAEARGAGFYVGNTLGLVNPSTKWWGEGDERVYVDGETTPSHFGTGTEDYYGYAWCSNERFSTPYIGQTASTSHESFGRVSLYRFHVLDPIPFHDSLRFDMEVSHWGPSVDVTYDSMSVWYARPGTWISGARKTDDAFRLPRLKIAPPPDAPAGPYRC